MTMTAPTSRRLFRILGTTDEVTECNYCGRVELKGTIRLELLDEDGNSDGIVFYGSSCAATAGKRKVKDIRNEAKVADIAVREARIEAEESKSAAWTVRRNEWIAKNVAPDALDFPRRYGYSSTVRLVQAFIDATCDRP